VAASNLASLIYNGAFTRFPRLHVVFAGFGFMWAVSFLWRANAEWRNLRGEVPWLTSSPRDVVAERVRFVVDGAADVPNGIGGGRLAELLPASTLVWGSDQPYAQATPSDAMDYMPETLAARIVGDNGHETFSRLASVGSVA
jgi:predicted TIM-barrel fold metal-dependent hydrolase